MYLESNLTTPILKNGDNTAPCCWEDVENLKILDKYHVTFQNFSILKFSLKHLVFSAKMLVTKL